MAFTPITKKEVIDGVEYTAQYNGPSEFLNVQDEVGESNKKLTEYVIKHVIVSPQIEDIDEYFGTDIEHLNAVAIFGTKVMRADTEYFPKTFGKKAKTANKE